jgi:hypothetical protein
MIVVLVCFGLYSLNPGVSMRVLLFPGGVGKLTVILSRLVKASFSAYDVQFTSRMQAACMPARLAWLIHGRAMSGKRVPRFSVGLRVKLIALKMKSRGLLLGRVDWSILPIGVSNVVDGQVFFVMTQLLDLFVVIWMWHALKTFLVAKFCMGSLIRFHILHIVVYESLLLVLRIITLKPVALSIHYLMTPSEAWYAMLLLIWPKFRF